MTAEQQKPDRAAYERAVDEFAEDCFFTVLLGPETAQERVVAPGEVRWFTEGFTWAAALFAARLDPTEIRALHVRFLRDQVEQRICELGE